MDSEPATRRRGWNGYDETGGRSIGDLEVGHVPLPRDREVVLHCT